MTDEQITDDFGNFWDKKCSVCGHMSIEVVRIGKVQCNCECGCDN